MQRLGSLHSSRESEDIHENSTACGKCTAQGTEWSRLCEGVSFESDSLPNASPGKPPDPSLLNVFPSEAEGPDSDASSAHGPLAKNEASLLNEEEKK